MLELRSIFAEICKILLKLWKIYRKYNDLLKLIKIIKLRIIIVELTLTFAEKYIFLKNMKIEWEKLLKITEILWIC